MTAALDRMPRADQAYRTARQVRNDTDGADVHRMLLSSFGYNVGHVYEACCGEVLFAAAGAILTTSPVNCPGCIPGWKTGPA